MSSTKLAERYHDISCGHRVYGHESKCAHLHGHNYRIHFTVLGELDAIGRVMDFSVIKSKLCMFLENEWDHHTLIWQEDPWAAELAQIDPTVVVVPFNPTAENMAQALLEVYGPKLLEGTGVTLLKVKVDETRKCSATAMLNTIPTKPPEPRFHLDPGAIGQEILISSGQFRTVGTIKGTDGKHIVATIKSESGGDRDVKVDPATLEMVEE